MFPVLMLAIFLLGVVGEICCVFNFIRCDFEPSYKAEVVYGVSMFTPAGAVVGYMDFGK
jgi:hypothetical protein